MELPPDSVFIHTILTTNPRLFFLKILIPTLPFHLACQPVLISIPLTDVLPATLFLTSTLTKRLLRLVSITLFNVFPLLL